MVNLWIAEVVTQKGEYIIADGEPYETYTDNVGQLFSSLQKEFGRCSGKQYIEREDQDVRCGWVFEKRVKYTDCQRTYLQETWVTVWRGKPDKTHNYAWED